MRILYKISFLLIFFLFSNCNPSDQNIFEISNGWKYKVGFDESWLDQEDDDYRRIDLPANITKAADIWPYSGHITVWRDLPKETLNLINEGESIALDMGRVLDVSKFYINGRLFAEFGSVEPYNSAAMRPVIRDIPDSLLRKDGKNTLVIVLYSDGSYPLQFMDKPYIGKSDKIFLSQNSKEILTFIFLTSYMVFGLYHLLLAWKRPVDKYNLYFGFFTILCSIYWFVANTSTRDIIFGSHVYWHRKTEHILLFLTAPSLTVFLSEYFEKRINKYSKIYSYLCLALAIATLIGPLAVMRLSTIVWQITFLLLVPYLFYFLYTHIKKKNDDANYMLGGIIALIISSLIDILASRGLIRFPQVSNFAFFTFIIGIATILANKFARITNDFELLNRDLEQKVNDRTKELSFSLSEIQKLKEQQDGDYFLTSLLIEPISGVFHPEKTNVKIDIFLKQKKEFKFRRYQKEIGGDICIADTIYLRNKEYIIFSNGDAMGKSIQGAGGALVFGILLKAIIERSRDNPFIREQYPEIWLKECFKEIQNVYTAFNGSMLISAIIGLINTKTGLVYYLNAEHPYFILYRDKKADFLENEIFIKKIGIEGLSGNLHIHLFQMDTNDVLICGSDGKDDLMLSTDSEGNRIINEDETKIFDIIEKTDADLHGIFEESKKQGEITDDFSLLRISFVGEKKKMEPIHSHPLVDQARKAESNGEPDIAEKFYVESLEAIGDNQHLLLEIADHFIKRKDFPKAGEYLERIIKIAPENSNALYLYSFIMKKCKEYDRAILHGERFRIRYPMHVINQINLADTYRLKGDLRKAKKILNRTLNIDPENDKANKLMRYINEQESGK